MCLHELVVLILVNFENITNITFYSIFCLPILKSTLNPYKNHHQWRIDDSTISSQNPAAAIPNPKTLRVPTSKKRYIKHEFPIDSLFSHILDFSTGLFVRVDAMRAPKVCLITINAALKRKKSRGRKKKHSCGIHHWVFTRDPIRMYTPAFNASRLSITCARSPKLASPLYTHTHTHTQDLIAD